MFSRNARVKSTKNADTRRNSAKKRSELESVRCRVPSWVGVPGGAGGATLKKNITPVMPPAGGTATGLSVG